MAGALFGKDSPPAAWGTKAALCAEHPLSERGVTFRFSSLQVQGALL